MLVHTIPLETPSHDYNIYIGTDILGEIKQKYKASKYIVVTDEIVAHYHKKHIQDIVAPDHIVILPQGEATKSFYELEQLLETILSFTIDRHVLVIAFGGGVIGDIVGLAASLLLRGVRFIQIPTTLLAQIDSSIGGKTAINSKHGKNLIGQFYQPIAVYIDTNFLLTLDKRHMQAGYAEMLKVALIQDQTFFEYLETKAQNILNQDPSALIHAINWACRLKADIVAQDEKETKNIRALLNLGHSFGHALELIGGYDGRLFHGEAVAIGLLMAASFSHQHGYCSIEVPRAIFHHLQKHQMPLSPVDYVPYEEEQIYQAMLFDKKNENNKLTLVLLSQIGCAFLQKDINIEDIRAFLKNYLIYLRTLSQTK